MLYLGVTSALTESKKLLQSTHRDVERLWSHFMSINAISILCDLTTTVLTNGSGSHGASASVSTWNKVLLAVLDVVSLYANWRRKHRRLNLQGLQSVNDPSSDPQRARATLEADGYIIKSVIVILARYLDSSKLCKVMTRCCSVLDKMTKDSPQSVQCAVECRGIEYILRVIMAWNEEKSNGSKHVVISSLCFLQNVTLHHDVNKKRVVYSGGCQHILGILVVNGKRETMEVSPFIFVFAAFPVKIQWEL